MWPLTTNVDSGASGAQCLHIIQLSFMLVTQMPLWHQPDCISHTLLDTVSVDTCKQPHDSLITILSHRKSINIIVCVCVCILRGLWCKRRQEKQLQHDLDADLIKVFMTKYKGVSLHPSKKRRLFFRLPAICDALCLFLEFSFSLPGIWFGAL